jgi:hypothetical protein
MVGKAQKLHGMRSGLYGGCSNGVPLIHFFQAEQRIHSPHMISGLFQPWKDSSRLEISKWFMVCSMFSRSGWSVVRSAPLAKGGTLKKRLSLHLHKVLTWSNKVYPWNLQMTLVFMKRLLYELGILLGNHMFHFSFCVCKFTVQNFGLKKEMICLHWQNAERQSSQINDEVQTNWKTRIQGWPLKRVSDNWGWNRSPNNPTSWEFDNG